MGRLGAQAKANRATAALRVKSRADQVLHDAAEARAGEESELVVARIVGGLELRDRDFLPLADEESDDESGFGKCECEELVVCEYCLARAYEEDCVCCDDGSCESCREDDTSEPLDAFERLYTAALRQGKRASAPSSSRPVSKKLKEKFPAARSQTTAHRWAVKAKQLQEGVQGTPSLLHFFAPAPAPAAATGVPRLEHVQEGAMTTVMCERVVDVMSEGEGECVGPVLRPRLEGGESIAGLREESVAVAEVGEKGKEPEIGENERSEPEEELPLLSDEEEESAPVDVSDPVALVEKRLRELRELQRSKAWSKVPAHHQLRHHQVISFFDLILLGKAPREAAGIVRACYPKYVKVWSCACAKYLNYALRTLVRKEKEKGKKKKRKKAKKETKGLSLCQHVSYSTRCFMSGGNCTLSASCASGLRKL